MICVLAQLRLHNIQIEEETIKYYLPIFRNPFSIDPSIMSNIPYISGYAVLQLPGLMWTAFKKVRRIVLDGIMRVQYETIESKSGGSIGDIDEGNERQHDKELVQQIEKMNRRLAYLEEQLSVINEEKKTGNQQEQLVEAVIEQATGLENNQQHLDHEPNYMFNEGNRVKNEK